ncbi:N-methyl-L-tryptophan oxidase [Mycolicibacterium komossense]|uniref:N-methyl-L-tryptophan oxidase n=1 Tax=Mycolicibacterium komossense TaxID=1779 RepID=UPI0021F26B53|nr:N-methyl-L-tryptophan oxidase [Mycolicibacterium komossense]
MSLTSASNATCDVLVVGLGIMGASAMYQLTQRGASVLGVDSGGPTNELGSSHGQGRIFRRAYWEGEHFLPLLNRSLVGWRELHDNSHDPIVSESGGLFIGAPTSTLIRGSRSTAIHCGIEHEYLSAAQVGRRFPAFSADAAAVAVYEPEALTLLANNARLTYLSQSTRRGARLSYGSSVRSIAAGGRETVLVRGDGWQVSCGAVVLTAGGWIPQLLPEVAPYVKPMRIPVFSFDIDDGLHRHIRAGFPAFLFEADCGSLAYGLAETRGSKSVVKVGFHNRQLSPLDDMHGPRRQPLDQERLDVWAAVASLLPGLRASAVGVSCVYAMSRDESFIIGEAQAVPGLVYASACSGHGFKFAPAIGEVLAGLALDKDAGADISAFSPDRFGVGALS